MEQSWARVSAVPCSAGGQYRAVKSACHDLVLLPHYLGIVRDSAGSHFSAGTVTQQGYRTNERP